MKLTQTSAESSLPAERPKAGAINVHVFPASMIDAMALGDVLQIVVFAFLFGAACTAVGARPKARKDNGPMDEPYDGLAFARSFGKRLTGNERTIEFVSRCDGRSISQGHWTRAV
jgi:hypothetical protein